MEENVKHVIDYLNQNSHLPKDELVQSCIASGYSHEECSQALKLVQSTSTPHASFSSPKILLIIVLVVFLLGGGFYFFYIYKNISFLGIPKNMPFNETDPIPSFLTLFQNSDYRITTFGKIQPYLESASNASSLVFVYDDIVFYTNKGTVVRNDFYFDKGRKMLLIKGDAMYLFDDGKKEYGTISTKDKEGARLLQDDYNSFLLMQLMQEKGLVWKKITSNEWETTWTYKVVLNNEPRMLTKQIRLKKDPKTQLITKLSFRLDSIDIWNDLDMEYQTIPNIQTYTTMPQGYAKGDFNAILSR